MLVRHTVHASYVMELALNERAEQSRAEQGQAPTSQAYALCRPPGMECPVRSAGCLPHCPWPAEQDSSHAQRCIVSDTWARGGNVQASCDPCTGTVLPALG